MEIDIKSGLNPTSNLLSEVVFCESLSQNYSAVRYSPAFEIASTWYTLYIANFMLYKRLDSGDKSKLTGENDDWRNMILAVLNLIAN